MTLDQIFFLLADRKILRGTGSRRQIKVDAHAAMSYVGEDGMAKGMAYIDKDGNPLKEGVPIKAKFGGKSLARQLMEAEERKNSGKETQKEEESPRQRRARQREERCRKREERRKKREARNQKQGKN